MQEQLQIDGKAVSMDVFPSAAGTRSSHAAVILMHGAGGNIGYWVDQLKPALAGADIALFAPHYFDRTGTIRADLAIISDGIHVPLWLRTLDCVVRYVSERGDIDPTRMVLAGVSLGAFLSLAYCATESGRKAEAKTCIRCLVEVSGGLAELYASRATSEFPPTLILHGQADAVVPVSHAHSLDALLTSLAVDHETKILPHEGHWFSTAGQLQLLLSVGHFLSRQLR